MLYDHNKINGYSCISESVVLEKFNLTNVERLILSDALKGEYPEPHYLDDKIFFLEEEVASWAEALRDEIETARAKDADGSTDLTTR